jgi:tripartite-type tricarboxylate transporter receptor subunit TctC
MKGDVIMTLMNAKKFWSCFLFALMFLLIGLGADALAKYPEKKIRIIVTMAPGGGADLTGRMLAKYANPFLGGRQYVENVDGGGGAIGLREAAKSAPDGYTVVVMVTNITIGPTMIKNFPTLDQFDPICMIATDPTTFIVKPDSRFKNIQEFIAYCKAHPGDVTISNPGTGSANYLASAAFCDIAGIKLSMIPFKGSGPALVAAMGGHVDVASSGCSEVLNYVTGKKLRPLVTFGDKRSRLYPEVPTAKELGYNMTFSLWRAVGVPKGTPEDVKKTLSDAFQKALDVDQFKSSLEKAGLEPNFMDSKEAAVWMKAQYESNKALAAKIGLKPE